MPPLTANICGFFMQYSSGTGQFGSLSSRALSIFEPLEHRQMLSGSLDKSFSGDGMLAGLPAVQNGQITATIVQSDGKTLVAGVSSVGKAKSYFITRLNKDGSPDKTFDGDGTKLITRTLEDEPDLALTSDGHIVLATTNTLVKLTASGKFDTSFGGGDGIATISSPGTGLETASLAIRPDGKLIVGVASVVDSSNVVRRFQSDGTLDKSFGSNGVEAINSKTSLKHFVLETVLRQSDGSILVVGTNQSSAGSASGSIAIIRLQSSGQLDKGYGSGGVVTTAVHAGRVDNAVGAALQSDGELVVAGNSFDAKNSKQGEFAIRYKTSGSLDKTFGTNGIREFVFLSDDDLSSPETASSIATKSDGKIDIAGSAFKSGRPHFAVIQLKSNGADDTSFGTNARAFAGLSSTFDSAESIAISPDKKVVLGGFDIAEPNELPEVARFT
jgi:uncharacterized delta-60 repeat protein